MEMHPASSEMNSAPPRTLPAEILGSLPSVGSQENLLKSEELYSALPQHLHLLRKDIQELSLLLVETCRPEFDRLSSAMVDQWENVFRSDVEHLRLFERKSWGVISEALAVTHIEEMSDELMDFSRKAISLQRATAAVVQECAAHLLSSNRADQSQCDQTRDIVAKLIQRWNRIEERVAQVRRVFRMPRNSAETRLSSGPLHESMDEELLQELTKGAPRQDSLWEIAGSLSTTERSLLETTSATITPSETTAGRASSSSMSGFPQTRSPVLEFERALEDRFYEALHIFPFSQDQLFVVRHALQLGIISTRARLFQNHQEVALIQPLQASFFAAAHNALEALPRGSNERKAIAALFACQAYSVRMIS